VRRFSGRIDDQVKLRGYEAKLSEIEHQLNHLKSSILLGGSKNLRDEKIFG
jgi:hypothetical protein